jgi:hypothetical protein
MRNDQLKQALINAGFKAEKETQLKRDIVSRKRVTDEKPVWDLLPQSEREYFINTLKSNTLFQN